MESQLTSSLPFLTEVYGNNFFTDAKNDRKKHVLNILAKNIAFREFNITIEDCKCIWSTGCICHNDINTLKNMVNQLNNNMSIHLLDKTNRQHMSLVQFLKLNEPTEYLLIRDKEHQRNFVIYLTPRGISST